MDPQLGYHFVYPVLLDDQPFLCDRTDPVVQVHHQRCSRLSHEVVMDLELDLQPRGAEK